MDGVIRAVYSGYKHIHGAQNCVLIKSGACIKVAQLQGQGQRQHQYVPCDAALTTSALVVRSCSLLIRACPALFNLILGGSQIQTAAGEGRSQAQSSAKARELGRCAQACANSRRMRKK